MKKIFLVLLFSVLFSANAYAKEDVLRCALKNKLNEPDIRTEVEIDLDKKILWADGSKYKINLIGEMLTQIIYLKNYLGLNFMTILKIILIKMWVKKISKEKE